MLLVGLVLETSGARVAFRRAIAFIRGCMSIQLSAQIDTSCYRVHTILPDLPRFEMLQAARASDFPVLQSTRSWPFRGWKPLFMLHLIHSCPIVQRELPGALLKASLRLLVARACSLGVERLASHRWVRCARGKKLVLGVCGVTTAVSFRRRTALLSLELIWPMVTNAVTINHGASTGKNLRPRKR